MVYTALMEGLVGEDNSIYYFLHLNNSTSAFLVSDYNLIVIFVQDRHVFICDILAELGDIFLEGRVLRFKQLIAIFKLLTRSKLLSFIFV